MDKSPPKRLAPGEPFVVRIRDSLQFRLSLTIVVVSALVFLAYTFFDHASRKQAGTLSLHALADRLTDRLAALLPTPLWNLDMTEVRRIIASEMLDRNVQAIIILDEEGRVVLAGQSRDDTPEAVAPPGDRLGAINRDRRITMGERSLGRLRLTVTTAHMEDELKTDRKSVV